MADGLNGERESVIVLGGTIPHCELIKQLKVRGYFTVLVDYYENPPAASVCDIHERESTLDKEAVLRVAKKYNARAVISGCVDQANAIACYAMEQMGKTPPYSHEMARRVTDKGSMKAIMEDAGVPTARHVYVCEGGVRKSLDELSEGLLSYPVMVKPADSNSANGVKKAECEDDLHQCLAEALRISRNGHAVVEEFLTGQEISAYCVIDCEGKAKLLMTAERHCVLDGPKQALKNYATVAPARISAAAHENAQLIAEQIAQACGFRNTPFFFQAMVDEDGRVSVIEFMPRVGGGVSFMTILLNTGFDIIEASIKSYLGEPISLASYHEPKKTYIINTLFARDCVFDHLEHDYEIPASSNGVAAVFTGKTAGMAVDNSTDSGSRVGLMIVGGRSFDGAVKNTAGAFAGLRAVDSDGVDQLRTDINIDSLGLNFGAR